MAKEETGLSKLTQRDMLLRSELARYGHTLGIAVDYDVPSTGHTISSEGSTVPLSMSILSELLQKYNAENDDVMMQQVADIIRKQASMEMANLQLANAINNMSITGIFRGVYKRLVKSKNDNNRNKTHGICLLPISTEGHGFYMAYDDKHIAVANRGLSASLHKFGVRAFFLKPGSEQRLDKINIAKIPKNSIEDVEKYISEFVSGDPAMSFDSKYQKTGNCTFANIKSLIKPLLYMLGETQNNQERYKKFTTWVREYEVKQLIQKYKLAEAAQDAELAGVYRELLVAYINHHCLNQSTFGKIVSFGSNLLFRAAVKAVGRDDIQNATSEISKMRRHANIAMIYAELKDDPYFKPAFAPIAAQIEKIDFKEVVKGDYIVKLPDAASDKILISRKELPGIFLKSIILLPVVAVAQIFAAITFVVHGGIDALDIDDNAAGIVSATKSVKQADNIEDANIDITPESGRAAHKERARKVFTPGAAKDIGNVNLKDGAQTQSNETKRRLD